MRDNSSKVPPMNLDSISASGFERLKRIQQVSRIVRIFLLACMAFVIYSYARSTFQNVPSMGWSHFGNSLHRATALGIYLFITSTGYFLALVIWYWFLAKLFGFYAQGRIFDSEAIWCIKRAGIFCLLGWFFNSAQSVFSRPNFYMPQPLPPGVTLKSVHFPRIGFFDFDFGWRINFGLLVAGVIVVLIAWIMDEGRKLQEEQALTV